MTRERATLELALLGPPVVTSGGRPARFDTRKATAVLALLAAGEHELSRERLAGLLWPDADSERARASLRRTLSVTQAATGDGLRVTRLAIALDAERTRADVREFEALAAAGDPAGLDQAARLYRDDFLSGFGLRDCPEFDDWQAATADRLRQRLAAVLEKLTSMGATSGDLDGAVAHAQRWLALDPLHEPAHQALIRLLAWTGQRSAALRQYRALVRTLDRELAVRPLPATTELYDDVRAGRLAPPPARPAALVTRPEPPAPAAVAVPAWPLTGRREELAELRAAWRAVTGTGRVACVTGPAGCGKTRLLAEFGTEVEAAGTVTLAVRGHDGETELPFVAAADLLRAAVATVPELPARLPAHTGSMAGRLCPELAGDFPDEEAPLDSLLALTRLYGAIADVLRIAAGQEPAAPAGPPAGVVLVDDVHWADGPTLGLLAYLVRRLAGWPVLLVLSWSADHADRLTGLRAALAEAAEAGRSTVIEPSPLTDGQVGELLAQAGLDGADVGLLQAQTRGLPMLVREYAEALRTGTDPGSGGPPASVRELLRRRVAEASEPTRQMLSTAAVLGGGCDADLLRTVSGRGETEVVEALDEAVRRFLLTEIPPPGGDGVPSYDFPYGALREVVYESATLARRRLLHSRAADALARRYERDPLRTRAATVAGHLQRAGRDEEAAGWWWRAAGRARDLYAHTEAYAYLRRAEALGYAPAEVAVALGEVLTVLGRYREALAEFETAAALADGLTGGGELSADGEVSAAAIEHRLAEVHHRLGDWDLAEAHLTAARDLLGPADRGRQARIEADRAVLAYRRGATGPATALAAAALTAARQADDRAAVAQALNVLGMLDRQRGASAEAASRLRESLEVARALPDSGAAVAALNNLARLLAETGQGAEALPLAQEALTLGRELGDQHRLAALHTNLADLLHAAGQRDAALVHLKEAARGFAAVDPGGPPRPEIWTLVEW
ncbi:MAG: AAA family ATPase [Actinobacteria bacterium]|nr:AAA family ATPase [Actinomycetota bacterium]